MTPRHPPRALTGLTTPIGAPPPGKEGGVRFGGSRLGPSHEPRRLATRRTHPGARFRISVWISKGSCSLLCSPPGVATPGGVKLCVKHATRPPSVLRAAPRSESTNGRFACGGTLPKGERSRILVPTTELPKSVRPSGRRASSSLETATPPARRGEGPNRGVEAADPEGSTTR